MNKAGDSKSTQIVGESVRFPFIVNATAIVTAQRHIVTAAAIELQMGKNNKQYRLKNISVFKKTKILIKKYKKT